MSLQAHNLTKENDSTGKKRSERWHGFLNQTTMIKITFLLHNERKKIPKSLSSQFSNLTITLFGKESKKGPGNVMVYGINQN